MHASPRAANRRWGAEQEEFSSPPHFCDEWSCVQLRVAHVWHEPAELVILHPTREKWSILKVSLL